MIQKQQIPYEELFVRATKQAMDVALDILTGNQFKLLMFVAKRCNGSDNGMIDVGARDAEQAIHVNRKTVMRDFRVLEQTGFLERMYMGHRSGQGHPDRSEKSESSREMTAERMSSEWRVTFLTTGPITKPIPATDDYLDYDPVARAIVPGFRKNRTRPEPQIKPARGRPKGSTNKPKPVPVPEPSSAAPPPATVTPIRPLAPRPTRRTTPTSRSSPPALKAVASAGQIRPIPAYDPNDNPF